MEDEGTEYFKEILDKAPGIRSKTGDFVKAFFIGKNFYVYRRVQGEKPSYRGKIYPKEGYILACADICELNNYSPAPLFINMDQENVSEILGI
jgi:hypothetical protein